VPSLNWNIQTHVTLTKLIQQCKLLSNCPATIKQKINMANTIIRPEILYSFYAVLYSMPTIRKLDKQIIAIQKKICGLQDWWYSMTQTPYKGPIRNLQEYIEKRDQKLNLQTLANSFPNISKWTHNSNIDNPTSTDFWIYSKVTKLHAFLNFAITNTWVMLVNNYSLALSYICPLHVLYATP
jgi:hypothetical protein